MSEIYYIIIMSSYCVKCRSSTGNTKERKVVGQSGRGMIKSECKDCGTTKCKFVGKQQGGKGNEKFASEAYKTQKKRAEEIDGYKLDKSLSNRNIAVYKDEASGKAIVSNRGTDLSRKSTRGQDLKNDAFIVAGKAGKIDRVKKTVKKNEELAKQGYTVTNTGHSLGGRVAYEASKRTGNAGEVYSAGTSPLDKKQKAKENIVSHRNKYDPVAANTKRLGIKNDNVDKSVKLNPHTLDNYTQKGGGVCNF